MAIVNNIINIIICILIYVVLYAALITHVEANPLKPMLIRLNS